MAAPADAPEQAFRLRRFAGTNNTLDEVFLGPQILARSQNWIPAVSFRLGKRPGTLLLGTAGAATSVVNSLVATNDPTGVRHLYGYCRSIPNQNAYVIDIQNESFPPSTTVPGTLFTNYTNPGRLIRFQNRVYAGNGVNPIISWLVGDTVTANTQVYGAMGATDMTGWAGTAVDNPAGTNLVAMPTGNYQCCFAVFNTATGLYVSRSVPLPGATGAPGFDVSTGANNTGQTLRFTAPSPALPANQVYRFFIAYRGFPIEYATAQGPDWTPGETRSFSSIDVSDLRCPINQGVMRTGNMFVVWRNQLVFAGMQTDPWSVYSTDTLVSGLEQQVYNQGTFFPVDYKIPLPDVVTGVGIAGVTTDKDAQSPLVFFTPTRTFISQGNPFDSNDTSAQLIEVSSRVGCAGHDSIVNTPFGTFWCGIDSVYMMPPGGGFPQDVGWPIATAIKAIPPGQRQTICATFHKGFYKLQIPSAGAAANTDGWWLDLRTGIDASNPSWWGPHVMVDGSGNPLGLSAFAVDLNSASEIDRGYSAVGNQIVIHHQVGLFTDLGAPISSMLTSGRFDGDDPFLVKVFTRIRAITQGAGPGQIQVILLTDGGVSWSINPILLQVDQLSGQWFHGPQSYPYPGAPPAENQSWRTATWGAITPVEAQTIAPYVRPRGLSVEVTLLHQSIAAVELRDFEIMFLLSGRKVRYLGERVSK